MTPRRATAAPVRLGAHLRRAAASAVVATGVAAGWMLTLPLPGGASDLPVPAFVPAPVVARTPVLLTSGTPALQQVPQDGCARDDPALLEALARVRIGQGRHAEAEVLAVRLTRLAPSSGSGWELLAASRYLQDDRAGALQAWARHRSPLVRDVNVRVLGHDGPRVHDAGTDPKRLTGISEGRPLTLEELVRGERRLGALPAGSRARLGYRALAGGGVALEGTVVLGTDNPFTRAGLAAHALRMVVGRVRVVSSDPFGRLERWELSGGIEGTLRTVGLTLEQPAPLGSGVWRWTADHARGRFASFTERASGSVEGGAASTVASTVASEERSGAMWVHEDWVTASLRSSVSLRVDVRPGRGTFAGAGAGWTLLPMSGRRTSVRLEGTVWTRIGRPEDGSPDSAARFGRVALLASLRPASPPGLGPPSGLHLRGGVVTVSPGAPLDLRPRIGAGGNTSLLMRARSDLDEEGVVHPLFPGRTWAHGGAEVVHAIGSVGPVGLGVAAFVDAVRVLGGVPDGVPAGVPGGSDPDARRGGAHLGVGMRIRIPLVAGWLRTDWGVDPADGASTISAAWVSGAS